jgi:hypothetical protein
LLKVAPCTETIHRGSARHLAAAGPGRNRRRNPDRRRVGSAIGRPCSAHNSYNAPEHSPRERGTPHAYPGPSRNPAMPMQLCMAWPSGQTCSTQRKKPATTPTATPPRQSRPSRARPETHQNLFTLTKNVAAPRRRHRPARQSLNTIVETLNRRAETLGFAAIQHQ